jgi:hypothetical protein
VCVCSSLSFPAKKRPPSQAMLHLRDAVILGQPIRCGWGKSVVLPATCLAHKLKRGEVWTSARAVPVRPIDSAPAFVIPSGALKFEVKFPGDKTLRRLIDKLAAHVARLGHIFEKCVMSDQRLNPRFAFLFDVNKDEHLYYRWKTYSLANGDTQGTWRVSPFQMMISGPFWIPPSLAEAAPDHAPAVDSAGDGAAGGRREVAAYPRDAAAAGGAHEREGERDRRRDAESDAERDVRREAERRRRREDRAKLRSADVDKLEALLRNLTTERKKVPPPTCVNLALRALRPRAQLFALNSDNPDDPAVARLALADVDNLISQIITRISLLRCAS